MRIYHIDNTLPSDNEIFVFGSNLSGIHGAGAAAEALNYGAVWGKGVGLFGRSYAIPTKDERIKTLPLREIKPHIEAFVKFTQEHPELRFFVTRIGCGLAGFQDSQIAPLFKDAANCSFALEWKPFL